MGAVGVIALALYLAPPGRLDFHFVERRLVSWANALVLLGIGALLHGVARASEAATRPWWFWELAGWGFYYLSFDEHFQFHERIGEVLEPHVSGPSWVNNLDDLVIVGYGVVGASLCFIFREELGRTRRALPFMGAGFVLLGAMSAIDALAPYAPHYRAAEDSLKLLAGAFFLLWALSVRRSVTSSSFSATLSAEPR